MAPLSCEKGGQIRQPAEPEKLSDTTHSAQYVAVKVPHVKTPDRLQYDKRAV